MRTRTVNNGGAHSDSSLKLDVYTRLRSRILSGELHPGGVFADSELARRLGVSRTPVREALNLLAQDNLVTLLPRRGAQIRELSLDEMIHVIQLREVLDGLAARLAAERIELRVLDQIEEQFRQLDGQGEVPDADRQRVLSRDLHSTIAVASGNPHLLHAWERLMLVFERAHSYVWQMWNLSRWNERIFLRRRQEHLDVITALRARDAQGAEQAARLHLANVLADMLQVVSNSTLETADSSVSR